MRDPAHDDEQTQPVASPWIQRQWQRLRQWQWRDVVINQVGANAQNVAVGKNIFQINIGGRNLTVPVLTAVLALLFVAGYLLYPSVEYLWNPSQMSGGFKIAVADFGLVDGSGRVQRSSFASMLSKAVFDKLESEYRENYPQLLGKTASSVQIWHDSQGREVKNLHFGVISSEAEAKTLAKTINADLVIYGTLTPGEQAEDFALQFYYAGETQRGEPDAISGRHLLGALIPLPATYTQDQLTAMQWINQPLAARTQALFWITVGLTYEATGQPQQALTTFQKAYTDLAEWNRTDGQGILSYFLGREAFWLRQYNLAETTLNEAKQINPNYANAYQTLGAVFYDRAQLYYVRSQPIPAALQQCVRQDQLDQADATSASADKDIDLAMDYLHQAIAIAPQSPWPPSEDVARLTLGLTYRLKGQAYLLNSEHTQAAPWLAHALTEFQTAQRGFVANGLPKYAGWAALGVAATYQMQAFIPLAQITVADTPEAAKSKKMASIALFHQAEQAYQQCIDLGSKVFDPLYKQKVLDCGCVYYQKVARDNQAQVEKTLTNQ